MRTQVYRHIINGTFDHTHQFTLGMITCLKVHSSQNSFVRFRFIILYETFSIRKMIMLCIKAFKKITAIVNKYIRLNYKQNLYINSFNFNELIAIIFV